MTAVPNEEDLIRKALSQILRQDICTSCLDTSLTHTISNGLKEAFAEVAEILNKFTSSTDFKHERTNLQIVAMKYRILMSRTLDEFLNTNENINLLSREQMTFVQNLTVLGGKLQSYNQLLATASNHAKIYDKLREAAILNEIDGQDAIEYLRRAKDSNQTDNPSRTDIKELVTTNKSFDSLVGIDDIVSNLRQVLINIDIGLVDSFLFFIFYGIPGTGKTALSESLATQFSNGEYYKFDQSFFASTYLGVTESRIRNIFETIRSNPNKRYTIIIDEADNVLATTPVQDHLNSIKILLQTEISSYSSFGTNLIIVCITNYLTKIDQTFRRRATNIIEVPPPRPEECINFLESQLTPPGITYTTEYRQALALSPNLVYTNSDMGRLAKNVRDNFLHSFMPDDIISIALYIPQRTVFFFSKNDITSYPPVSMFNNAPYESINKPYLDAMRDLAAILARNNTNIQHFQKYFAPNIVVMNKALSRASTLTKEQAQQYLLK
ncbi:ATPase family associated with various cellular activities (AAA) [Drosophila suzukii associated hytrosavirus 1]|nr:ATPase family associated with various cellular activities (AAA) [Drosophila suzukii associated hytrosavirus 1]